MHPKAGWNTNSTKKRWFSSTPSGNWPAFACQPALKSRQNGKKHVYVVLFSDIFSWFQLWNHWKRFKINKKGWKRLKEVFWTAFGCAQYPKAGRNAQQPFLQIQISLLIFGIQPYTNSDVIKSMRTLGCEMDHNQ